MFECVLRANRLEYSIKDIKVGKNDFIVAVSELSVEVSSRTISDQNMGKLLPFPLHHHD